MKDELEKFFNDPNSINNTVTGCYSFFKKYSGWSMDPKEGAILYNFIKMFKPEIILELGTYHGISAAYMLSAIKDNNKGFLYTIDNMEEHVKVANLNLIQVDNRFSVIHNSIQSVKWNKPIDFLFVDGTHTYDSCSHDLNKFFPYIKNGGCIFIHDMYIADVKKATDNFITENKNQITKSSFFNQGTFKNGLALLYKE